MPKQAVEHGTADRGGTATDIATDYNQITFDYGKSFFKNGDFLPKDRRWTGPSVFLLGDYSLTYATQPAPVIHRLTLAADGPIREAPDVSAAPVPEPAGWAVMLAGFALLGGGLRLRRSHRADVAATAGDTLRAARHSA